MPKRPFSRHSDVTNSLQTSFEYYVAPDPVSGCWLWTGPTFKKRGGYGCFTCRPHGVVQGRAHRVAWAIYRHPISPKEHVLHKCDNPLCVNPDHLFLGDQNTNMQDKVAKGRQTRGETHGVRKLTENEAISIRNDQRLYTEIAEDFGISVPTVSDIKRARSWQHLGPPVGRYTLKVT